MSIATPATAAFLALWNPLSNEPSTLVRVTLAVPGALTLNFATRPVRTPDSVIWQPMIARTSPIDSPGEILDPGPAPVTFDFTCEDDRLNAQATGTLSDLMRSYLFEGATVQVWLWVEGLTSFADALPVFSGVIGRVAGASDSHRVTFFCAQRRWNRQVPPNRITQTSHPNAPASSLGLPRPLVYGEFRNDGMRQPWTGAYSLSGTLYNKTQQEDCGDGALSIPGILIDSGVGGADAKILLADHALLQIGNAGTADDGYPQTIADETLARLEVPYADLLSDKSGFYLKDNRHIAWVGVPFSEVRIDGSFPNTALKPRGALDLDETNYASLEDTGTHQRLSLIPANVGQQGELLGCDLVIGYRTKNTSTEVGVRYNRPDNVGNFPGYTLLTAHTGIVEPMRPVVERVAIPLAPADPPIPTSSGRVTRDWNFAAGDVNIAITSAANQFAHVFFCRLVARYRPSQALVTPPAFLRPVKSYGAGGRNETYRKKKKDTVYFASRDSVFSPAVYEVQGQFYANVMGRPDSTGAYTDVVDEVIEVAPDIARHFLENYCNQSPAQIEVGVATFGSFIRARSQATQIEGNQVTLGCHVGSEIEARQVLEAIGEQTPAMIRLDRFTDKWHFIPWNPRPQLANFPRRLVAEDILENGLEWEYESDTQLINQVGVRYAFDHFRSRHRHQCFLGPDVSEGGFGQPRDQLLKFESAINDRIDINRSGLFYVATIAPGTYDPAGTMAQVRTALTAAAVPGCTWNVSYGGWVVASHNDRLDFDVAGSLKAAAIAPGAYTIPELVVLLQQAMQATPSPTPDYKVALGGYIVEGFNDAIDFSDGQVKKCSIPPGYYRTVAHLAKAVALALNSQSSNWTCTQSSGTLTIGRSSGTAQLLWLSGANAAVSAAAALGFSHAADRTGAASYVGDYAVSYAKVMIQTKTPITLKWASGSNIARSIATTLGFNFNVDSSTNVRITGNFQIVDEWFAIGVSAAVDLLWLSGANLARSAGATLGYMGGVDDTGVLRYDADVRRGSRETACATSRDRYGLKHPFWIDGDYIRGTRIAANLRDVIFAFRSEPLLRLKVRTHRLPDLQNGRILETGDLSSIRPFPRYGGSGWAGRLWYVVEVRQHAGPAQWHQEAVLVEVPQVFTGAAASTPDGPASGAVPTGTAFLNWYDTRTGAVGIYGARLALDGSLPWTANGVRITTGTPTQPFQDWERTKIAVDGDGSSIHAWIEGTRSVRVQKLNAAGTKLWTAAGVVAGEAASGVANQIALCSDAAGGCFVAWRDTRNGSYNVFVMHVLSSGVVDPAWPANGVRLAATANAQIFPRICPDGQGGVIACWGDARTATPNYDLFVQRLTSAGAQLWTVNGVQLNTAGQPIKWPDICPDGTGGAFFAWNRQASNNVFVSRIVAGGSIAGGFTAGGTVVASPGSPVQHARIVSDGSGNAFMAWIDERSGTVRIYGALVTGAGSLPWASGGVNLMKAEAPAGATADEDSFSICLDGLGGFLVACKSDGETNIRAQRLTSTGALLFAADGVIVGTGANSRYGPVVFPVGDGGGIVAWTDERGVGLTQDIYAQRFSGAGIEQWSTGGAAVVAITLSQKWPALGTV